MKSNIPDFQTIMLPFLELLKDAQIHTLDDVMGKLTTHFKLNKDDLRIKVPSGQMGLFRNRVGWSRSYLKMAGLIEYPNRGNYRITNEGLGVLRQKPKAINIAFLKKFSKFQEWQQSYIKADEEQKSGGDKVTSTAKTPDESLGESIVKINQQLAIDLIDILNQKTAEFFERFVLLLLDKMGYGGAEQENFRVVGKSNDGGIDGVIFQDKLGLDQIYVQAKRWKNGSVSSPDIRNFIGALNLKGAMKGIFITTSEFSKEAKIAATKNPHNRIVLIDGAMLAELAIKYNVGVQVKEVYELKEVDFNFFED